MIVLLIFIYINNLNESGGAHQKRSHTVKRTISKQY